MFGHETRPTHFFIPVPIFIIGGLFVALPGRWDVWDIIGGLVIASGVACIWFLGYTAVKDKEIRIIEQEHAHLAEIMKMDAAKTKTKVTIDKTPVGSPYVQQAFTEVEIAPAKLKKFAHGVLMDGKKLTIREWTPLKKGKLFSRNEWERLIEFMKRPEWENKVKFIVPINVNNENDGYELTAAGREWLQDVLEDSVISVI
jgi:hypothetical protein